MTKKSQLFSYYDIGGASLITGGFIDQQFGLTRLKAFPFVRWPSGRPCEIVNVYLLDVSMNTTGDSIKTYASQLSHLVRYCGDNDISFDLLKNEDIHRFSTYLQKERKPNGSHQKNRNHNSTRSILARSLALMIWLQDTTRLEGDEPLVGLASSSPRITIQLHASRYKGFTSSSIAHSSYPVRVSKDPKRPIAQSTIEKIEMMVENIAQTINQSEPTIRRNKHRMERYSNELEYLRVRRRFMIWLLKRTGMRPSEMVELKVSDHVDILKTRKLYIPTKKLRLNEPLKRCFPISLNDAATVTRYLAALDHFIQSTSVKLRTPRGFFVCADGRPIKKESLEKDFSRLALLSGFKDCQVCLSMFRHRFITMEVIVHFKEFMQSSGKTRQLMTDADYRSILKRIATKTGHGSEDSLWHYIDLAWSELDVWGGVDRALARFHAADELFEKLLDLRSVATRVGSTDLVDALRDILVDSRSMFSPFSFNHDR